MIGLSGGLDSTLALLVTVRAFDMLQIPRENIHCITMPCFGTTDRTYTNACTMAKKTGASLTEINIRDAVTGHFKDINHDIEKHDVTYENGQARERTQILMDIANEVGGMVIGTVICRSWLLAGLPTTGIICPCMALMHLCRKH